MTQYFWNSSENRLRAGWRLAILGVLTALAALPVGWIANASEAGSYYWRQFAASGAGAVLMMVAAWIQARWVDRRSVSGFGLLRGPQWILHFVFGLLLGAALMALVFGAEWAAGWLRIKPPSARAGFELQGTDLVALFLMYLAIAVIEELAARGALLRNLSEGLNSGKLGPVRAVIVAWIGSSVLLGALHLTNETATFPGFLFITAFGLFTGLAVVWTRSLAIPIGAHATWKFFEGPVFGFPVDGSNSGQTVLDIAIGGPVWATGGTAGPEGGLLSVLVLAIGAGVLALWVRWRFGAVRVQSGLALHPEPDSNPVRPPASETAS